MSNATENNSPRISNQDDHKSHFHATHDEAAYSQPSTAAHSPFNSFIVEYDIGAGNLYPHGSKEPNIRMKKLTLSGELVQPKSVFSRNANNPAMQPPAAQLMGEYDPNRIPGTAFSNKNGTTDWSITSNESLFSIHMGNASFNRDHPAFFQKSQELPRLDDMMNHFNGKQDFMLHQAAGTLEDPKKEASTGTGKRFSTELSSTPRNSNGSTSGVPAFSFPILDNADIRNSLGKLSPAEIHMHNSFFETPKAAPYDEVVMNPPVAAAVTTPTVKTTCWFPFPCCRG